MNDISALGIRSWEADLCSRAVNHLAGDSVQEGTLSPRLGALSLLLRQTEVYLHDNASLREMGSAALADGHNILVDRNVLGITDRPADLDAVDTKALEAAILAAAQLTLNNWHGEQTPTGHGQTASFVTPAVLGEALEGCGLGHVNAYLRYYDERSRAARSAVLGSAAQGAPAARKPSI